MLPEEFRSEILALLRSGRVRNTGHVQVDGRDAIRLESLDGKKVYVVDAATYDPPRTARPRRGCTRTGSGQFGLPDIAQTATT